MLKELLYSLSIGETFKSSAVCSDKIFKITNWCICRK
jgi:hypothetical protein